MIFFIACHTVSSVSAEKEEENTFPVPNITELMASCDSEQDQWFFEAWTDGWTSNGHIWMTDGVAIEKHNIYSAGAPPDGSSDNLYLELEIVSDWRDAVNGKHSRWLCSEEETLGYMLTVRHPENYSQADCASWGLQLWSELEDVPECDQVWDD